MNIDSNPNGNFNPNNDYEFIWTPDHDLWPQP
jgi:hypothetical protein